MGWGRARKKKGKKSSVGALPHGIHVLSKMKVNGRRKVRTT